MCQQVEDACNFLTKKNAITVHQFLLMSSSLSKLPYEVTPEQAMSHDEVRNRLEASSLALRSATDKVLNSIVSSLDKIP